VFLIVFFWYIIRTDLVSRNYIFGSIAAYLLTAAVFTRVLLVV